ncbi:Translocation protein sec62 [Smittium mucronatum]|uniref:Translocation protein SEC62 n=1 Tax=Smittium mucronatum TaxID=133383 RepID=A0A1R0H6S9_9FUNG|nr:Translocation protein sec62 [Smittium mucronatum]
MADSEAPKENVPKEVYKLADFLLGSSSGLRKREGVINGRRVNYFKGKSAINALTKSVDKREPFLKSQVEAIEQLHLLLDHQLIVRCDKNEEDGRTLRPSPLQVFSEEYYYAWIYQGSPLRIILGGIGLVLIVLAGVMFPLWPSQLRQGSYYLSLLAFGFLGLLFVIAIIRLIIYVITIFSHPPGLWIFPNLFEDVGFFESFVPLYAWEVPKTEKKKAGSLPNSLPKTKQVSPSPAPASAPTSAPASASASAPAPTPSSTSTSTDTAERASKLSNRRPHVEEANDDD